MILLTGGRRPAPHLVAVFGGGLIGSAVVEACERVAGRRARHLPLSWSDPTARRRDLRVIERTLSDELPAGERPELGVVWAAGAAGFAADEAEAAAELASFRDVVATCRRLAASRRRPLVAFHLVSSAGGLFEGRRLVGPQTELCPRRPYGRLKATQERELLDHPAELTPRIYRLSSVFGPVAPRRRRGLIPTLILNGLRRSVSTVTGHPDTLRDFIWAPDVGRHLARELARPVTEAPSAAVILASGKPSSLHEVQRLVETALRRRLHVSYRPNEAGAASITFSPSALSPGWRPSTLCDGVCKVRDRILGRGARVWT